MLISLVSTSKMEHKIHFIGINLGTLQISANWTVELEMEKQKLLFYVCPLESLGSFQSQAEHHSSKWLC